MLKRLYIDNYRCFVDFEFKPAQLQLILGGNGTGKSSFMDALEFLRKLVVNGAALDDLRPLTQNTRWLGKPRQTFEYETLLGAYQLELEAKGDPPRAEVNAERVMRDITVDFLFKGGRVQIPSEKPTSYEADPRRSALAAAPHFAADWLRDLSCFRLDPFRMGSRAEGEALFPEFDLTNLAGWYRHLVQTSPRENECLRKSLVEAMDGFDILRFQSVGEGVNILQAEFRGSRRFNLSELSDGQRCLIALYMILHFIVAKGGTVVIDEPENFISLREIQPWLMALRDAAEQSNGQVLLISHHPGIIDQWAPENGVLFVRDSSGAVRTEAFHGDSSTPLTASELIARGWERE